MFFEELWLLFVPLFEFLDTVALSSKGPGAVARTDTTETLKTHRTHKVFGI